MNAPLVCVARGGKRIAYGVEAGYVDGRITFDETRQLGSLGSHVANLKQEILTQRPLHVKIPILRVGQGQVRSKRQVGQRCRKRVGRWRVPVVGISKIGESSGLVSESFLCTDADRSALDRSTSPCSVRS